MMNLHTHKAKRAGTTDDHSAAEDAVGYIIDEQGREVAITEHMIQQACEVLEEHWIPAPAAQSQHVRG